MRLGIFRGAVVIAALAVAACAAPQTVAPQAAPPNATPAAPPSATAAAPPPARQNGPAAFTARARQVTAQWNRSAAARAWRTGLVLLDPSGLTPVPAGQGFASQRQKDAFGSGHFTLAATLPAQPLTGLVQWAGGATLRPPLLTARAAFAALATQRPCGDPACGQLAVTGAQPGTVTVLTSRGLARVPAWRFTVTGLSWPVAEIAVARSALVVLPGYGPIPAAGRNTPGVSALTTVSADGRTLTVGFDGSACDAAWGAYRYQSPDAVVTGSWEQPATSDGACPDVGFFRAARVTLTRPLGTRVVLDVATGLPLLPGRQAP